jgi:iron complex transport system substrate-binding protein
MSSGFILISVLLFIIVLAFCAGCVNTSPQPVPATAPTTSGINPGTPVGTTTSGVSPAGDVKPLNTTSNINQSMAIKGPVHRIVVVNTNAAELLVALGAKDNIVGASETVKNHPVLGSQFADIESIGSWQTPNIEKIISLNPDLVVSYASSKPKNEDQFTQNHIPILYIDCYRLDTLESDAKILGSLTVTENAADSYGNLVNTWQNMVRSRVSNVSLADKPRVYFEGYSDYNAQPGSSGSGLLVRLAGGRNIAENLSVASSKVSAEWVVTENPDVIIKVVSPTKDGINFTAVHSQMVTRPGMQNVNAVRNNRVFVISADVAYGPRSYTGLLSIAKMLYPDRFSDISPETALDEYARNYVPGTNQTPFVFPQP